jgi:hypothetical protein
VKGLVRSVLSLLVLREIYTLLYEKEDLSMWDIIFWFFIVLTIVMFNMPWYDDEEEVYYVTVYRVSKKEHEG